MKMEFLSKPALAGERDGMEAHRSAFFQSTKQFDVPISVPSFNEELVINTNVQWPQGDTEMHSSLTLTLRALNKGGIRHGITFRTGCILFLLCALMPIVGVAQTFTIISRFNGVNGAMPLSPLVQGLDGDLYGVTYLGGSNQQGTVYKLTLKGVLTTLYSFCAKFDCADGAQPASGLVVGTDGNLYGVTSAGGNRSQGGTFYRLLSSGTLTTLHRFCAQNNCTDGTVPDGIVQGRDEKFYGTTYLGGANNRVGGTVFQLTRSRALSILYNFCAELNCNDGSSPNGVIQATNGNLYGTTNGSGAYGGGTVFKTTFSGRLTILHNFCSETACADGGTPEAELIQASDGNFYGTTSNSGAYGYGTVFKITPSGRLTTLHSFAGGTDGANPYSTGLIEATDGNFYGATYSGGVYNQGVIFKLTPYGAEKILYSFQSHGAANTLFQATDGNIYGTKSFNTIGNNNGAVFRLNVGLGPFVELLPTSGVQGTKVTILGTDLTGATQVSFNGKAAAFTVVSPTEIRTSVPNGTISGIVTVMIPKGRLASNVKFRVP